MKRLLLLGLVAQLLLLPVALRHRFFWGETLSGRLAEWFGERPALFGVGLPVWLNLASATVLALFAVLAGGSYVRAARLPRLERRSVWLGGLVLVAVAVLPPPWLSTDVFDYLARGRVEAVFGENPYLVTPQMLARGGADRVFALAEWPGFVMPYGPVSAVVQRGIAAISGEQAWIGVYLFKLLFAACHVLTAVQVAAAVRAAAPQQEARALLLWLWNPWLLVECAGSAHNEALMALALATMVRGIAERRFAWATCAFGLAVLTKHGCAPLGPLLLVLAWRERRVGAFALGVAVTVLIAAPLAWHYFREPGALGFLAKQTANRGASAQYLLGMLLGEGAIPPLLWSGYAITLAALLVIAVRVRSAAEFAIGGSRLMLLFLLAAMPLFSPWYHLWWLPLVGLALVPQLVLPLQALAILGPAAYIVQVGTRDFGLDHHIATWLVGLVLPAWMLLRYRPAPRHDLR